MGIEVWRRGEGWAEHGGTDEARSTSHLSHPHYDVRLSFPTHFSHPHTCSAVASLSMKGVPGVMVLLSNSSLFSRFGI